MSRCRRFHLGRILCYARIYVYFMAFHPIVSGSSYPPREKVSFSKRLDGTTFVRFKDITLDECFAKCQARKRCKSLNYMRMCGLCEMNAGDEEEEDGTSLKKATGYLYSKKLAWQETNTNPSCQSCTTSTACQQRGGDFQCIAEECGPPENVSGHSVLGNQYMVSMTIRFRCQSGQTLGHSQPYSTCQEDGTWSPSDLFCAAYVLLYEFKDGSEVNPYECWTGSSEGSGCARNAVISENWNAVTKLKIVVSGPGQERTTVLNKNEGDMVSWFTQDNLVTTDWSSCITGDCAFNIFDTSADRGWEIRNTATGKLFVVVRRDNMDNSKWKILYSSEPTGTDLLEDCGVLDNTITEDVTHRKCYKYHSSKVIQSVADSTCVTGGWYLADIKHTGEQTLLYNLGKQNTVDSVTENIWIGGTDSALEGSFVWSDGTSVRDHIVHWGPGQPDDNDWGSIREDCIVLVITPDPNSIFLAADLNDMRCTGRSYAFVCERGRILARYQGIPLRDCFKKCQERSRCASINYRRILAFCVLSYGDDANEELAFDIHYIYSKKMDWAQDNLDCPECEVTDCGHPMLPSTSIDILGNMYSSGNTLKLRCRAGYIQSGTYPFMTCSNTGDWTQIAIKCFTWIKIYEIVDGSTTNPIHCRTGQQNNGSGCYRLSSVFSRWTDISRVKIKAVGASETMVAEFNVVGSDMMSWFQASRVISTNWMIDQVDGVLNLVDSTGTRAWNVFDSNTQSTHLLVKKDTDTNVWNILFSAESTGSKTEGCGTPTTRLQVDTKNGKCYRLSDLKTTWDDAREICQQQGWYFSDIKLDGEQKILGELVPINSEVFIGASDQQSEGLFVWTDGSVMDNTVPIYHWLPNQPDNAFGGENCLTLIRYSNWPGLLNDAVCWKPELFICEIDIMKRASLLQIYAWIDV